MSELKIWTCFAKAVTALVDSAMALEVDPAMALISAMDLFISSLEAACCSLAAAMALT